MTICGRFRFRFGFCLGDSWLDLIGGPFSVEPNPCLPTGTFVPVT